MTYFPACAGSEEEGPTNFTPSVTGDGVRLMEARRRKLSALDKLAKETVKFHETMAVKHGLDTSQGLAHFRAARSYQEAKNLEKFFESHDNSEELNPKAVIAVNAETVKFHKSAAKRAGLDSDEGHAHVHAVERCMASIKEAKTILQERGKEAKFGHSSKKSPFPGVPRKKDMPNDDIRQDKPVLPLRRLQQQKASQYLAPRYEKSHQSEGGPGSGPRKRSMFAKGMNPAAIRRREEKVKRKKNSDEKLMDKPIHKMSDDELDRARGYARLKYGEPRPFSDEPWNR